MRGPTIVAIMPLCACGRLGFDLFEGQADAGRSQFGPWGDLRALSEINTAFEEITPSLSADATELYFSSNRNSNMVLFRSTRPDRDALFGVPVEVPLGEGYVSEPALAKSGLVMYMHTGAFLIARSDRVDPGAAWSMPTKVPELVPYDGADFGGDDLRLVLNDFEPQTYVSFDLYETRADTSSAWLPPHVITELVTPDSNGTHRSAATVSKSCSRTTRTAADGYGTRNARLWIRRSTRRNDSCSTPR